MKIKKMLQMAVSVLIVGCSILSMNVMVSAASIPSPSSEANIDNVMKVLSTYDHDSYHILDAFMKADKTGNAEKFIMSNWENNFTSVDLWDFVNGNTSDIWSASPKLISSLDTAVHETFHQYTHTSTSESPLPNSLTENIYAGNGVNYRVDHSGVSLFKTSEALAPLGSDIRTFRYDTYVSGNVPTSANMNGTYGLLNEFTAYYWNLEVISSLTGYFQKYDTDASGWNTYTTVLANGTNAYAEFKFWILQYLVYAKSKYPDVYKSIINNKDFCNAYTAIESRYSELIAYENGRCASLLKNVKCDQPFMTTSTADYDKIIKILDQKKYTDMDKLLKSSADKSCKYSYLAGAKVVSADKIKSGVKLTWTQHKNADGYYIYRSVNGGKFKKIKTIGFGDTVSWTDKSATNKSQTYKYAIKPFNITGTGKLSSKVTAV